MTRYLGNRCTAQGSASRSCRIWESLAANLHAAFGRWAPCVGSWLEEGSHLAKKGSMDPSCRQSRSIKRPVWPNLESLRWKPDARSQQWRRHPTKIIRSLFILGSCKNSASMLGMEQLHHAQIHFATAGELLFEQSKTTEFTTVHGNRLKGSDYYF